MLQMDQQGVVTKIKGGILPSIDYKPIEIPKVKTNIPPPPANLSADDVGHMVDQALLWLIDCKKTNRWWCLSRLESDIDCKVHSAILHVNDEFTKKQYEFAEPSATPANIGTFCNNSQDGHNYPNSDNDGGIVVTPSQPGTSSVATSVLLNQFHVYSQLHLLLIKFQVYSQLHLLLKTHQDIVLLSISMIKWPRCYMIIMV
jgi:hypothetical protein